MTRKAKGNAREAITKIVFKHEDEDRGMAIGPVWKIIDGRHVNYKDSDMKRSWDDTLFPEWFTLRQAQDFAKQLGVPIEEV